MDERRQERRGLIFDEDADLYERVRPTYPRGVFEDLAHLADLEPGSRVLEIGVGTGQATLALAARGYEVLALEPGRTLAAVAARKLAPFASAHVEVMSFERWVPPPEPFDAVVAATSFHWLEPTIRVEKAADALQGGGALAIISTHHVAGGDAAFFEEVQDCYLRHDPATQPGLTLPREEDVHGADEEIAASELFGPVQRRLHPWEGTYLAHEYRDLLMSYSGHRALPPDAREDLLRCITRLIDDRFGGRITKRYLFALAVARRLGTRPRPQ